MQQLKPLSALAVGALGAVLGATAVLQLGETATRSDIAAAEARLNAALANALERLKVIETPGGDHSGLNRTLRCEQLVTESIVIKSEASNTASTTTLSPGTLTFEGDGNKATLAASSLEFMSGNAVVARLGAKCSPERGRPGFAYLALRSPDQVVEARLTASSRVAASRNGPADSQLSLADLTFYDSRTSKRMASFGSSAFGERYLSIGGKRAFIEVTESDAAAISEAISHGARVNFAGTRISGAGVQVLGANAKRRVDLGTNGLGIRDSDGRHRISLGQDTRSESEEFAIRFWGASGEESMRLPR